jgi:hypothetical protein
MEEEMSSDHYSVDEVIYELRAENQRLREALERIKALKTWDGYSVEDLHAVAREALAGDAE